MYQRLFYFGLIAAAALILIVLGAGALYEYQIKPNQVLATVNGQDIKRKDYWQFQIVTLYEQAQTFEDAAATMPPGDTQSQYLAYAAQFDQMRGDVWGSSDVNDITLRQMIEGKLYVRGAEDMGIDMSTPTLESYALSSFAPTDTPLQTPIPTPTLIPDRAAWATETAKAEATQQAQAAATATEMAGGTPGASPVASPAGTAAASPMPNGTAVASPGASPLSSPAASATPDLAAVRAQASSDYTTFQNDILDQAKMDVPEYLDEIVKPKLAKEQVDARIVNSVPQSGEQVEVHHILVSTEDLANEIAGNLNNGADFTDQALQYSIDSTTAPTGGDLGWITRFQMPADFTDQVFGMEQGQVSAPFQTSYGWEIVKVNGKASDRAFTNTQYQQAIANAKNDWLTKQAEAAGVSKDDYEITPTPTAPTFTAPVDAPTPVYATPLPAEDLSGTPVQGPPVPSSATPGASPAASPGSTPVGTPAS